MVKYQIKDLLEKLQRFKIPITLILEYKKNKTSRGRLNLTFKGRPWDVDLRLPLKDLENTQT